jgi:hypothetical protein
MLSYSVLLLEHKSVLIAPVLKEIALMTMMRIRQRLALLRPLTVFQPLSL